MKHVKGKRCAAGGRARVLADENEVLWKNKPKNRKRRKSEAEQQPIIFKSNQMKSFSGLLFGVCLCLLLTMTASVGAWQSNGNFTADNITFIQTTLTPIMNIYFAKPGSGPGAVAAKNISDALNLQWGKAWNVIILQNFSSDQAIFYGYAFNGHWLWWNAYAPQTSIIIWKDYNCLDTWTNVNSENRNLSSTVVSTVDSKLAQIVSSFLSFYRDPWQLGFQFITEMTKVYPDQAYSAIVCPGTYTQFFGYVCVFHNAGAGGAQFNLHTVTSPADSSKADLLVMRMR